MRQTSFDEAAKKGMMIIYSNLGSIVLCWVSGITSSRCWKIVSRMYMQPKGCMGIGRRYWGIKKGCEVLYYTLGLTWLRPIDIYRSLQPAAGFWVAMVRVNETICYNYLF